MNGWTFLFVALGACTLTGQLFRVIERLKERGCGIVYISHKMNEILAISDEVTVMRDGTYISTDKARDLTTDKIIAKMVGGVLPILAKACKADPAVMASPFITTIVDAVSLLVYFMFAKTLLGI